MFDVGMQRPVDIVGMAEWNLPREYVKYYETMI